MSTDPFALDAFLPYRLAVAASRVSREFAAIYQAEFGISVPEWRVLAHLAEAGTVSVREIEARVDMEKSKVSRAAARLVAAGHVAKAPDPKDGRLVRLSLTPGGRALMARIVPRARAFDAALRARLGPADGSLEAALDRLMQD